MDIYTTSSIKIPNPSSKDEILKIKIKDLFPTQMCIGLAEVLSRKEGFKSQDRMEVLDYLKTKPVPLVSNSKNDFWMLDRHHRLRALLEIDNDSIAYGYIVARLKTKHKGEALDFMKKQGWLYLFNKRGIRVQSSEQLPNSLLKMEDDPYRSIVWKLKKEGFISSQPQIPYNEFRWANWLRSRPLPPFNSNNLIPALPIARSLAKSIGASHLPGWKG